LEIEETKPIRKLFSLEAKLLRDEEGSEYSGVIIQSFGFTSETANDTERES